MKNTSANMMGYEGLEWANAAPWLGNMSETDAIVHPHILVVDDDPMFCKRFVAEAKSHHLSVTPCQSVGDLIALPRKLPFDVAVIDYFFGELTAQQIVHL